MKSEQFWLFKSEPSTYSIDQLKEDQVTFWDGVRNYRARNFLWKETQIGDWILFYHSNAKPSGVCGVAKVVSEPRLDPTSLDPKSDYFDPKSSSESPRWYSIDVGYVCHFPKHVPLNAIKEEPFLQNMQLAQKGDRLSIQPITENQFCHICKMGELDPSQLLTARAQK